METIALLILIAAVLVAIVLIERDRQKALKFQEAERKLEEIRRRSRWESRLKE